MTKYFTQTSFYLNGLPQGDKKEFIKAHSEQEAVAKMKAKYAGYGAEYGRVEVLAMTENDYLWEQDEHIRADFA